MEFEVKKIICPQEKGRSCPLSISGTTGMRSPIKNSSRVPAYQNPKEIVGFCDFLFKPLATRLARGLESGSKPLLNSERRGWG